MGKVKSWAWDCAEEQVDDIIKSVKLGKITKEQELPSAVDDAAEVMSGRQKILLARKKNLQRRKRSKLPTNLK